MEKYNNNNDNTIISDIFKNEINLECVEVDELNGNFVWIHNNTDIDGFTKDIKDKAFFHKIIDKDVDSIIERTIDNIIKQINDDIDAFIKDNNVDKNNIFIKYNIPLELWVCDDMVLEGRFKYSINISEREGK